MAYIGQGIKQGTFKVLDTSGNTYNGSNTTFSLGTQVGSAAQLLVSHDGVIQLPGTDYTLASGGTQITFSTAPASGASIFIVEISGAVGGTVTPSDTSVTADKLNTALLTGHTDIGAGIADADLFLVDDGAGGTLRKTAASRIKTYAGFSASDITGATELAETPADTDEFIISDAGTLKRVDFSHIKGGGITQAQQWRLTASFNASNSSGTTISSNWEISDSAGYGSLGSNMTESSGVFTFPSTGYYLVVFDVVSNGANSAAQYQYAHITVTTNNSSYNSASITGHSVEPVNYAASCTTRAIIDVTDTSQVKVKFQIQSQSSGSNTTITGSTSVHYTGVTFIRLGDT